MHRLIAVFLSILAQPLFAQEQLNFKQDSIPQMHWLSYGLALLVLLALCVFLAKKSKNGINQTTQCKVIERIPLHHKARVYVVDYQGHQFLIADNQHALAIHPLKEAVLK